MQSTVFPDSSHSSVMDMALSNLNSGQVTVALSTRQMFFLKKLEEGLDMNLANFADL